MLGDTKRSRTAIQSGVNRRSFLGRTAGAVALASVGAALSAPTAFADSPRRGGVLRQGLMGGSASDTLDPAVLATQLTINVNYQLANCLVEITPEMEPIGELSESWDASDQAKTWVFKLRKGVQFHNGKEMTAADVVYSLNRHRGPNTQSAVASQMKIIEDVKATGSHEVVLSIASPYVDFPYLIGDFHLTISPEGDSGLTGIGTGPYALQKFDPGVRYHTKRNPNYFKSDRGWFDEVETLVVNDELARATSLLTNSVDMINGVPPRMVDRIQQSSSAEVVTTKGRNFLYFPMRCDKPPFDNNDLRLALKYAVNREEMVKVVLFGFGSIGNDNPISSAYPLYSSDIPQRKMDLDKAAFHYKKSGHSGPIVLEVSDAAFPGATDAALLLQRSCAKANMQIDVKRVPADGYWDKIWNVEPFCASTWSGAATQDLILSIAFLSTAPWNDSKWSNPKFDNLIVSARGELDTKRRVEMYREAVMMVRDEAGHLTPMFNDYIDGISKKVKGFVKDPNFELSGYRAPERCWFA